MTEVRATYRVRRLVARHRTRVATVRFGVVRVGRGGVQTLVTSYTSEQAAAKVVDLFNRLEGAWRI